MVVSFAVVGGDEPEAAGSARCDSRGGKGVARREGFAGECGGIYPADPRMAGICARDLLVKNAAVCGDECVGGGGAVAGVLLDGEDGDGVFARRDRADVAAWVCAPYSAADGDGALFAAAGSEAERNLRVVSRRICRCGRVGGAAQHARYVAICGRRRDGFKTVCGDGQVYRPDEQLLQRVPV